MKKVVYLGFIFIFSIIIMIFSLGVSAVGASAKFSSDVAITQKENLDLIYDGTEFTDDNGKPTIVEGKSKLMDVLNVKVNGILVNDINYDNIIFDQKNLKTPGEYKLKVELTYKGFTTTDIEVNLRIKKKELKVQVLLSDSKLGGFDRELTLDEGEKIYSKVNYEGFVEGESVNDLEIVPTVIDLPKFPVERKQIYARGAVSKNYAFVYEYSYLTINSAFSDSVTDANGNITVEGKISPLYKLIAENVEVSRLNPKYISIDDKINKYYGNELTSKYEAVNCYKIGFKLDNVTSNVIGDYTIKINPSEELKGAKDLRLVVFYENGDYDIKNVSIGEDNTITFDTNMFGDFVILKPIKGMSDMAVIGVILLGAGVVVLVLILVAVFRKKY